MTPVPFDLARRRASIAPVTTGTTKLLRVVELQDLFIWMTDKRLGQTVRLFTWPIGSKTRRRQIDRLADACVANFATVDDVVSIDTDLMAQDRVVVIRRLGLQALNCCRPKPDQMVLEIIVTLLRQLGGLL